MSFDRAVRDTQAPETIRESSSEAQLEDSRDHNPQMDQPAALGKQAAWQHYATMVEQRRNGDAASGTPAVAGQPEAVAPLAAVAAHGTSGSRAAYPHLERIQQSFGSHDISSTQAHIGGPAAESAAALGAEAFAHGDAVVFRCEPSLWLAAHEAAHVVQQRRGVQVAGGIDGGGADCHEQHADAVANAVVAGQSAEALLSNVGGSAAASGPSVQRFVEREHKAIGDEGSGGASYQFLGLELTHGDLVMLNGDHFAPDDLKLLVNIFSPVPGQTPGTQDEIFYVLFTELGTSDPRFAPGGKWAGWAHCKFSDTVKKSVEGRYYTLAAHNDAHFANPRGPGSAGSPGSADGTYRRMHEAALKKAYDAGRNGENVSPALEWEAMGQHFLTDSFASGHLSTPRTSISEYWNTLYPKFGQQFLHKVAHDVAVQLGQDATGLSDTIPVSVIEGKAKEMIVEKLGAKPLPRLGDIIGLTAHAADNRDGLRVANDLNWHWQAHGDHKLEPSDDPNLADVPTQMRVAAPACTMSNRNVAVTAVQLGIEEVKRAYALGKDSANPPMSPEAMLQRIRQHPTGLAKAGEKYSPEQLMPSVDATGPDQGTLNWKVKDLAALWMTQIRSTAPQTYGDFIAKDMNPGGEMGDELDAIKAKLDEKMDPFPLVAEVLLGTVGLLGHGHLFPRRAFDKAVLQKLHNKDTCLAFLLEIVNT